MNFHDSNSSSCSSSSSSNNNNNNMIVIITIHYYNSITTMWIKFNGSSKRRQSYACICGSDACTELSKDFVSITDVRSIHCRSQDKDKVNENDNEVKDEIEVVD